MRLLSTSPNSVIDHTGIRPALSHSILLLYPTSSCALEASIYLSVCLPWSSESPVQFFCVVTRQREPSTTPSSTYITGTLSILIIPSPSCHFTAFSRRPFYTAPVMSTTELESFWASRTATNPIHGDNDDAVDESAEADGDFVKLQKNLNQKKRAGQGSTDSRIQKVFPFPFLPNIRPLTVSDLESAVALESAAFHSPEFRATPEKVRLVPCS